MARLPQCVTRQCQTVHVYSSGTVLSDVRVQVTARPLSGGAVYLCTCLCSGLLTRSGIAQSTTQLLQSHPWQQWLRFLCVFAQEAVGQGSHSTLLQSPARAGTGTGVASSLLE